MSVVVAIFHFVMRAFLIAIFGAAILAACSIFGPFLILLLLLAAPSGKGWIR